MAASPGFQTDIKTRRKAVELRVLAARDLAEWVPEEWAPCTDPNVATGNPRAPGSEC